jgi:hypothetical protein
MKNMRVFKFDPDLDPDPKVFVNTGPCVYDTVVKENVDLLENKTKFYS